MGKHYQMHAAYNNFYFKQNENGGIMDDEYITNPEKKAEGSKSYESNNIPVRLESSANRNHNMSIFLTHRYRLGFTREVVELVDKPNSNRKSVELDENDTLPVVVPKDTIRREELVPVTSFIHTFKLERTRHSFKSQDLDSLPPALLNLDETSDSTVRLSIKNHISTVVIR